MDALDAFLLCLPRLDVHFSFQETELIDFNMMKNFRMGERQRLQFRAEFFNLLNHANLRNPEGNFAAPNFGPILSTSDPRLVQMALRYSF